MKIGYTIWTWMQEEFGRATPTEYAEKHFLEAIHSVSHLGYTELECFNFLVPMFEDKPEELKSILAENGLELVNLYHTYYEDDVQEYLDLGERTCKLLKACGAKYINVQGNIWHDEPMVRGINKPSIENYAKVFTQMGEVSKKYGIKTLLHPHSNTSLFHEDEIDYFLSITDRDLIGLTMDTAHTTLAGMDAEKAFDKYGEYIHYVHLKDLDPNPNAHLEWPMKRFCALGQGSVDFKGVIRSLKKHNYDGVLCVEVDYPLVCNYETAMFSRNYIRDVLGL